jgi:hypothetical protein
VLLLAEVSGDNGNDHGVEAMRSLTMRAIVARAELERRLAFAPLHQCVPTLRLCDAASLPHYEQLSVQVFQLGPSWFAPEVVSALPATNPDAAILLANAVCAQALLRAVDPTSPTPSVYPAAFVLDGLASCIGGYVERTADGFRRIPLPHLHSRVLAETKDFAAALPGLIVKPGERPLQIEERRLACVLVDFLLDGSSAADLWQPAWNGVLVHYLQHLQRTRDRAAADAILTALDCDALGAALRSWCERHQRH